MFQLAARIICVAVAQLGEDNRSQNNEKQGGSKDISNFVLPLVLEMNRGAMLRMKEIRHFKQYSERP